MANVTHWYGASLDVAVGRSIYLLGSADVTRGDLETNDQFYLSFGYQL